MSNLNGLLVVFRITIEIFIYKKRSRKGINRTNHLKPKICDHFAWPSPNLTSNSVKIAFVYLFSKFENLNASWYLMKSSLLKQ